MRTLVIILGGLLLLGLSLVLTKWVAVGPHAVGVAARVFIEVWLLIALANMWIGVARAAYTVAESSPSFW